MTSTLNSLLSRIPVVQRKALAIAGFLAGYGAAIRRGYATDLRVFTEWCDDAGVACST